MPTAATLTADRLTTVTERVSQRRRRVTKATLIQSGTFSLTISRLLEPF